MIKKTIKWGLYIVTSISIFMSIFSIVAEKTEVKVYDFEIGKQVVVSTNECPCWEQAIPFMIVSIFGITLITIRHFFDKKSEKK